MIKFIQKTKGAFAPLLILVALSSQGFAEENKEQKREENNTTRAVEWYIGAGLNMTTASSDDCEDITYGFMGKLGYDFNDYIGVEGRAIRTNWEDEGAKVKHAGVFAKPMLPINKDLHIYGLIGYAKTSTGEKKIYSDTGVAWGFGLNYYFGDDNREDEVIEEGMTKEQREEIIENQENHEGRGLGIFIDYERLIQKSNAPDFDSISIGVSYDF
jgi:OOP family OmpA-OmpF porin